MQQRVLVIDDEKNMLHMLSTLLGKHGYDVATANNGVEGLLKLRGGHYDYILCDLKMPVMDGMAFLQNVQELHQTATIIMMSAYGTIDQALETVKQGAYDYISKPFKLEEILLVLRKAEERERLRQENFLLKKQLDAMDRHRAFGGMIGKSKAMQAVFTLCEKVAKFDTTVLITGESGTGKELIARGIHQTGGGGRPFVAVNCGGIPENLLESELFGYVRGAFTGADKDKKGLFEEASGGTIFLDEIGDLPLEMQVKLLRVLQQQEVRRVGAVKMQAVRVRVLAATNKDLTVLVAEGRFRQDLFYRLNVLNIHVPPLRQRKEDIPLLCHFFLERFAARFSKDLLGIAPAVLDKLVDYDWPGNVRELENILERAFILCEKKMISPEFLPEQFGMKVELHQLDDIFTTYSLKKAKCIVERKLIARAMEATGGNKSKAAQLLELSYPALLAKLKEHNDT